MISTVCALTSQISNLETLDLIRSKVGGLVDLLKVNVGIGVGLGHLGLGLVVVGLVGVNPVLGLANPSSLS